MMDPDYDVVVSRINEIYNSSTRQEQQMLKQILGELAHSGYSYTYEQIFLNDFKEVPVGIDTFLDDPYYLGETNSLGKNVYPFWRKTMHDIFDNGNRYTEVILSGGTRIGKSSSATTMMAYMLYRLMLYRDPHNYFNKKAVSRFTLGFANLTKDLALSVCYRELQDTLKLSEWFCQRGTFTRSDRNFYYVPEGNNIEIIPASSGEQLLGKQVWCLVGHTQIITPDGLISLEDCNGLTLYALQYDYYLKESKYVQASIILTKHVTETIRIELDDGTVFEGTPEHMIMLSDGSYKRLDELTEDDDVLEV